MNRLIKGFGDFRRDVFPQQRALFEQLAAGQNPHTLFITCADSRVMPEMIFSAQPGELFVYRNIGNIVPPYAQLVSGVVAAIEYAVKVLKIQHIVICGHSDCGAMKALQQPQLLEGVPAVKAWLKYADVAHVVAAENGPDLEGEAGLSCLTEENVICQLEHLRTLPAVAAAVAAGNLRIHGWVYDIADAQLRAFDASAGRFVGVDPDGDADVPDATPLSRFASQAAPMAA
jgi:carbonic anhydrase